MYSTLLIIHSILRWGVLVGGLYSISRSAAGLMNKSPYTASHNRTHAIFVAFCHTQLLIGIMLYLVSPKVDAYLANGFGAAMKDSYSRLIVLEHVVMMVIAVALIQVGRTLSKRTADDRLRHKRTLIFFSIGMLLILLRIPWSYSPIIRL